MYVPPPFILKVVLEYNVFMTKIHVLDTLPFFPFNSPDILKDCNNFKILLYTSFQFSQSAHECYFKYQLEKLRSLQL